MAASLDFLKAIEQPHVRNGALLRQAQSRGVLRVALPLVNALYGVAQVETYHPEVDTGWHQELALDALAYFHMQADLRAKIEGDWWARMTWAILAHDIGKARTPESLLPKHHQHERRSAELCPTFQHQVLDVFPEARISLELNQWFAENHLHLHQWASLRGKTRQRLLTDAQSKGLPLAVLVVLACCDKRGRLFSELEVVDHPFSVVLTTKEV